MEGDTHSFTEYCDGLANFAESGFDPVIIGRHGKRTSLFLSLELVEDELVFYASVLAVVGESIKREFGHCGHNYKGDGKAERCQIWIQSLLVAGPASSHTINSEIRASFHDSSSRLAN
jgi:hypothetical protein